ncbi:MAG: LPS export ABC transporter periplasmic protein LptC [Acidobacteriota bacterium]
MNKIRLVSVGKVIALVVFITVAVALGVYFVKKRKPLDLPATPKILEGEIVAVFNNTRYAHEVGGKVRFVLTAEVDKAYTNGAHELEKVKLESFGNEGTRNDTVTADRAEVSDTANLNALEAKFISNVVVITSEGATIKTQYLHYDHEKSVIDTPELVEFDSDKVSGTTMGAMIEVNDERVHLLKDVDLTIKPTAETGKTNADKSASAKPETTESDAERAARKAAKRARKLERKRQAALAAAKSPNKNAPAKNQNQSPTDNQLLAARNAKLPIRIRAVSGLLERQDHRVAFNDKVIVTQGADEMRANTMLGLLSDDNKIERIEARGNAYLKQSEKAEIKSSDMDFFFAEQRLIRATATGSAFARTLSGEPVKEARAAKFDATFMPGAKDSTIDSLQATGDATLQVFATGSSTVDRELRAAEINVAFLEGAMNTALATGGAVLQVHAPKPKDEKANPTERELTASQVTASFYPGGKNLAFAEATENAVMKVTPVRAEKGADKKTIRAPQMTAEFFESNNRLKNFKATNGVKVEIEATVENAHPLRTTTSRTLTADFIEETQDVQTLVQQGDFKYNEGDRNGTAETATYNGQIEMLYLRGKRPMVWDAEARTQANEIDYDRSKDETHARGDVRTTYYSRETAGDATPFKNTKSPVFMTAEKADARNSEGYAIYTGNARGWQDNNFVKADRIELFQNDKKMIATSRVESALYNAKKNNDANQQEVVPGFATADKMIYSDKERLVHYEGSVKARQGTDNIEAAVVDVHLMQESNEVEKMIAEGAVVLTQPGRRGTGDKAIYTSADGRAILVGKNARVEDAEKGTTTGGQLTFYSRDDKVVVENQQGTGRVKTTHRLTKNK